MEKGEGDPLALGRLLRRHRERRGLSQEALAEQAGAAVHANTISNIERGRTRPYRHTLEALSRALDLDAAERAALLAAWVAHPPSPLPTPFTAAGARNDPAPRQRTPVADRPPFPTPAMRTGQRLALPVPLTNFVGRERESAEIAHLLERTRLLTLTGPGGTGKTRLALHVIAAGRDRFADGVVFVPLASIRDPRLVPVTIATGLDVPQDDASSLVQALIAHMQGRQILLVLDNFEQIVAAAPMVAELLAHCPCLTILVTSRMPLHLSGEQEYAVPPLAVPVDDMQAPWMLHLRPSPAVDLFVQRAQLVRPDFALTPENAPIVREICRRLDGLPLAIELAAARVKLLAPADLLARLGRRLQVLTGGPRDRPEHQQTVRGTMDWSYNLLSPPEQRLFRRLAVFVGGWTLEAAEAVCGRDDPDGAVLETLASLVDKSLLVVEADATGEIRYGLLETIWAYALERLTANGEAEALQGRHALYFQQLAERAAPEPGWTVNRFRNTGPNLAWVEWSEREQDNLRAARQWAHDHDEIELEMRLMVPLIGCWYALRQLHEAQDQLEQLHSLQEQHRDRVPADLLVQALMALAGILWMAGEYGRAKALMEDCVVRCRTHDLGVPLRASLHLLCHITCEMGEYVQAKALCQELLGLAREASDTPRVVGALLGLSDVARGLGDAERIVARCEEALALLRAMGDAEQEAFARHNLGIARMTGDAEQEAFARHNLGIAAWLRDDLARASTLLADSLTLVRESDYTPAIAEVLTSIGRVERAQGLLDQARSTFVESLNLACEVGPYFIIADSVDELAGLAALQHRAELAARLLGAARAIRQAKQMRPPGIGQMRHEHAAAEVRGVLGDAAFEAAYAAGQSLGRDEAIALALEAPCSAVLSTATEERS